MNMKGKMKRGLVMLVCLSLLLLCCVVVFPQPTGAAGQTYYVDQTAGNDNNNGTSTSTPWKNCPGMTAYSGSGTLASGDTVYFDKADTWLCTGTYGLNVTGGVTYIGDTWGASGTRATIRANANLSSVVEFRADNPTTPTIVRGFNVDGNHKYTSGVGFYYPSYVVSTPLNGAVKRVENCDVHNTWSDTSLGQYAYGIIVSNHGDNNSRVENVEILNNTVHDTSRDALCLYPGDENSGCIVKNITVRGNTIYNSGQDPNYGAGSCICIKGRVIDSTVENNYTYNSNASGIFMNSNETNHFGYGIENLTVRYNIVGGYHQYGSIRIYDGSSGGDPKDIKVYGNVVYSNSVYGFLIDPDLKGTNTLRIYNNTFYNAPVSVNAPNATFSLFEFKNNIAYDDDARTSLTGSSYFTASSNNVTTNPTFKNTANLPTGFTGTYGTDLAPNNDGLNIQSGSNAKDTGTALGSPYNSSINTVTRPSGSAWDAGAYEYNAGGPTNTPGPTPTPTPTPTSTPTPVPGQTPTPTPTQTPAPTSTPTPTPVSGGWTRVEDSSASINFQGAGWTTYSDSNCSSGTIKRTGNGVEYADFTFTGTGVRWYDTRDTNRGISKVYIDSTLQTSVDEYGTTQYIYKMYEKTGLTNASHTIRIESGTTKNASSSGYICGIDCFEYTGSTGPTPTPTPTPAATPTPTPTPAATPTPTPTPSSGWTRVEENGTGVSYDGVGWTTYSDSNCSGGTLKRTGNNHEYAYFTFTGTGVRWYDKRDTNRGKTDVYIDNVKQTTVDGYGSASYIFKMYEKTGLSSGSHTLKLDTTGTKNASSSGTQVGVDCFEYTN